MFVITEIDCIYKNLLRPKIHATFKDVSKRKFYQRNVDLKKKENVYVSSSLMPYYNSSHTIYSCYDVNCDKEHYKNFSTFKALFLL